MAVGRVVKVAKDGNFIRLYLRTEAGKVKVLVDDFRPYFYVPSEGGDYVSIFREKLAKVYAPDPSDVPRLRAQYAKHYEADVPYARRFMIDAGIYSGVEVPASSVVSWTKLTPRECKVPLRTWYMDIEVYSDVLPTEPKYPVCAVTFYDSYLKKYVTFLLSGRSARTERGEWVKAEVSSELDLFRALSYAISKLDPDVIVGWNLSFDVSYLRARARELGFKLSFEGQDMFDMLAAFKRLYKRPSYRLKAVAMEEGFVKEGARLKFSTSMSPDEIAEYNKADVEYLVKLDRKYQVLDFFLELKELAGVHLLEDAPYSSTLIDTALLRLAKSFNYVLPSKSGEEQEEEYEGAIVFEAPTGLFSDVAVFDIKAYYPSIIISFNISPETLSPDGEIKYPPTGVAFKKERGLYPTLCEKWLSYRAEVEKRMASLDPSSDEYRILLAKRNAVKYLINAIYGYLAYSRSRLYNVKLAETVTAIGREGLLKLREIVEGMGYKVLYGDTDSVLIQIPQDRVSEVVEKVNSSLSEYFVQRYGLDRCLINIKSDAYASKVLFFGVKKRYAMKVVSEGGRACDYVKVVGLEAVRMDQSKFSKKFQRELIELVLRGASEGEIRDYVLSSIEAMKSAPLIDVAINKGIDKPLDQYKSRPPHVRAALWSNVHLGTNFRGGDRIYFVWVRGLGTDVVGFDEESVDRLPKVEVDWEKMVEVNIVQKAEQVLRAVGMDVSKLVVRTGDLRRWL